MNQPWKVIVVLVAIFVAGGLTGGFVTHRFFRGWPPAMRPLASEQWAPRHLKRLSDRLGLTTEQEQQILPLLQHNMEDVNRLRVKSMTDTRAIFEHMNKEIADKLTPEQRVKFDQFNRDLRERLEKFRRGGPGGAPHDHPPGDEPPPPPAPEKT